MKSNMGFRLAYLGLTLAYSEGQLDDRNAVAEFLAFLLLMKSRISENTKHTGSTSTDYDQLRT